MSNKLKKKVLRACGANEKERVARAIHKLKVVVHAVVPPVVLVEAKNAPGPSQSEIFHGHLEGKRVEADGQRSDRSEQREVNGSLSLRLGVQKVIFVVKMLWVHIKKCASRRGQEAFFFLSEQMLKKESA